MNLPSEENQSPQINQQPHAGIAALKEDLQKVLKISSKLEREYELKQQADKREIPLEIYRQMLDAYCQDIQPPKKSSQNFIPLISNSFKFLSQFSIIYAALSFLFISLPQQQLQAEHEAWRIILSAQNAETSEKGTGSYGRIKALQSLTENCKYRQDVRVPFKFKSQMEEIWYNIGWLFIERKNCVPLNYVNLDRIYLAYVNLEGARLQQSSLNGTNLYGANLKNADLRAAKLQIANLENADLTGANLQGANIQGADLNGAIFCKTIMPVGEEKNDGCQNK